MNRLSNKLMTAALASASLLSFGAISLSAQSTAGAAAQQAADTTTQAVTKAAKKTKEAATPPPSASDIADAKTKGLVWVNTHTKVYHKSDSSRYGATKHGKFMTEDDAQKAGYKAAQESLAKAKKSAATAQ